MTTEVWAAALAASLAASGLLLAYARAQTRRVIETMPAEFEDRALALFALRRRAGWVPALGAVGVLIAWVAGGVAIPGAPDPWTLAVFTTTLVVLIAATTWIVSAAQVGLRSPEWRRTAFVRSAVLGAGWLLGPLVVMGWVAPVALTAIPTPRGEPSPAVPLAYLAGIVATNILLSRLGPLRRPEGEPSPEVMAAFAAAAGGPVPRVRLIDTKASGHANAYAYRARGREEIVISAELLPELTTDEAAAILLHELGHHRLGHIRRRTWTLKIGLLVLALLPLVFRASAQWLVTAGHALLFSSIMPRLWQRQETEADLYAAARCGAETTGSALRKLHRAMFLPSTWGPREKSMTHPGLARRLAALAVPAAS